MTRFIESITRTLHFTTQLNEKSIKRHFYRDFLLFISQLLWFKTYTVPADAKQRKRRKSVLLHVTFNLTIIVFIRAQA
jgi:hypothetical protein